MKNNDDILEVLEQHWERVDEIAEQSQVRVVRWNLPESPRRWVRSIAASGGCRSFAGKEPVPAATPILKRTGFSSVAR